MKCHKTVRTVKRKNQLKRLQRVAGLTNNLINRWRCAASANCQPCAQGGTVQKPSRRHTREGSATDATKPASPVLAGVLCPLRLEKARRLKNWAVLPLCQGRSAPFFAGLLPRPSHHRAQLPSWQFRRGAVVTPWWCPRRAVLLRTVATRRRQSPNGNRRLLALPHPSP